MKYISLSSRHIQFDLSWSVRLSHKEQKKLVQVIRRCLKAVNEFYLAKNLPSAWKRSGWMFSIYFCGDKKMRTMNRAYRDKDSTTDVLSFPQFQTLRAGAPPLEIKKMAYLPIGDIVISHTKAHEQAQTFNISWEDEVIHLFVHGFFHLLGFDHEKSNKEEKLMVQQEEKLLKMFK